MTDSIIIPMPDGDELSKTNTALIQRADAMTVTTVAEHAGCLEFIKTLAGAERAITALFKDPKKAASDAHKSVCGAEKKLLDPVSQARQIATGKATRFETDQRIEAERKAAELREQIRKQEEDKRLKEAMKAEKAGDQAKMEELLEKPIPQPIIQMPVAVAKVDGISTLVTWRAEVTDLYELVCHIAKHPEDIDLVEANMPNLNRLAKMKKDGAWPLPGVRAAKTESKMVRAQV